MLVRGDGSHGEKSYLSGCALGEGVHRLVTAAESFMAHHTEQPALRAFTEADVLHLVASRAMRRTGPITEKAPELLYRY